jgi:glycosyltransferase involved in cell wall biosynthesis
MTHSPFQNTGSGPCICHLASTRFGGAGIAASRLHDALRRCGVDSLFATEDPRSPVTAGYVTLAPEHRSFVRRIMTRLRLTQSSRLLWEQKLNALDRRGVFVSGPAGRSDLPQLPVITHADIVHLHWVAGLLPWESFFNEVTKPLVWTLHDMQPFKGIFHYTVDRDRTGADAQRLNEQVRLRKVQLLRSLRPEHLTVVTPSRWLNRLSVQSEVLGRFRHQVIPYGLDTQIFRAWPAEVARGILGLPASGRLLLVVAERLDDYRKGLDLAVDALACSAVLPRWGIAAAGAGCMRFAGRDVFPVGSLNDPRLMALLYSAVDLVLVPSREDNLPNVILESLCCGTPVVVTPSGGCPEAVFEPRDGLVCKSLTADSLACALQAAGEIKFDRAAISAAAHARYDQSVTAAAYRSLYNSLLVGSARLAEDSSKVLP